MTGLLFREWLARFDREMATHGRNVLLLLDNAPSHAVGDLQLGNTTVRMLPPRTTSRIQPMDAGIIAALKRRYRARQLALAVDRDEAGEANIYKVDVLQAMRWVKQCWRDISTKTIANCWLHTGLLNVPVIPEAATEPEVEAELHAYLLELALPDPFNTADLVDLAAEREVHHEFTDADLVEMACTEIDDEDSEDEELMVKLELATEEKLRQIRNMLVWMDKGDEALNAVVKELRRVQRMFKDELLAKQRESLVQTSISSFFFIRKFTCDN